MSAVDSIVVGVGCVKPAAVMRDPVTTSSVSGSFFALASEAGASVVSAWAAVPHASSTDAQ
jgi:hypothetical protein